MLIVNLNIFEKQFRQNNNYEDAILAENISTKHANYHRQISKTRLLGRFAPIFYLNCENILFVYMLKQNKQQICGFHEKNLLILKIY